MSLIRPGTVTTTETTTHAYNDANQLLSETYANGVLGGFSVVHEYDSLLRPKDLEVRQGTTPLSHQDYGFDSVTGRFKSVTQGAHTATYSYVANSDLIGQIDWAQSGATKQTTIRESDSLNRLKSIGTTTPGGAQMSYSYRYNDANQRSQVDLADGTHWSYGYDGLGQVNVGKKYWNDGTSAPVPGQQFEYTHDDIGNRTATKVGGNSTGGGLRDAAYTPNLLNQYTSRTVPGAVDFLGIANAASTVTVNGQSTYRRNEYYEAVVTVDNSGGPVWAPVSVSATRQGQTVQVPATPPGHVIVPPAAQNFQSPTPPDADGNLKQDGVWTYTWDGENRLIAMESSTGLPPEARRRLEFDYDWQGRRIANRTYSWTSAPPPGLWSLVAELRFLYDGCNLVAVLNAQSVLQQSFVWGLDLSQSFQGAGGVGGLLMINDAASGMQYVACDGNGNVMALISAADGSTTARYEYGPFGEPLRLTGTLAKANPFRFSSKFTDDETDLVYYGYRYYSPSLGRWISRDPLDEAGGANLYGFLGNDPVNYIDLWGLSGYRDSEWFQRIQKTVWRVEEFVDGGCNVVVLTLFTPPSGNGDDVISYLGNPLLRLGAYKPSSAKSATDKALADLGGPLQELMFSFGGGAKSGGNCKCQARRPGTVTKAETSGSRALIIHGDQIIMNNYSRYYDEAWLQTVRRFNAGEITIPAGMSWQTVLGQYTDAAARARLNNYLESAGIPEGPGTDVLVNRWLRDPSGSGGYRIPDVRLIQTGTILDGTIGIKSAASPQVQDFSRFSGGDKVIIVKPSMQPGF